MRNVVFLCNENTYAMKTIRLLFALLLVVVLVQAQDLTPVQNRPPRPMFDPQHPNVHDPVMIKEGDTYHLFCTGRGITHLSSQDMKTWAMQKPVIQQTPSWVKDYLPDFRNSYWAPDVLFYQGRYHVFYSCSAFGKNTSMIGHTSAATLDLTAVWTDHGMVVKSVPGQTNWNAIDPNVIVDEKGTPWMDFGSFWGGIQLVKMKKDLSGLEQPVAYKTICSRPRDASLADTEPGNGAVEAPFIFRHGNYYYLFPSYDFCCRGLKSDYNVVVGRSKKVTGPYLDMEGKSLEKGGGTVVLEGDEQFVAAGHCGVYTFDNTDYLIAHGYSKAENGASKLIVRVIEWDAQGWPVLTK